MKILKKIFRFFTKTKLRKFLSLLLAILMFLTSIKYIFTPIDSAKASDVFIDFNEGNGTTASDATKNLTASTITGATWKTGEFCLVGSCLHFSTANANVSIPDAAPIQYGAGSFTISFWFKHQDKALDYIVSKFQSSGGVDSPGYAVRVQANGDYQFCIDDDTNFSPDRCANSGITDNRYEDDQWHFLTAVKNGTTSISIYIDGVLLATNSTMTGATGTLDSTNPLTIGHSGDGQADFTGFIDEFKIYGSARTQAEINADYLQMTARRGTSAAFGPDNVWITQGLVGYWPMNEGVANTCTGGTNDNCDFSGHAKNGAWTGNATSASAKFGYGTTYDGTGDYTTVAEADADGVLDFTTGDSFSVSFWANPTAFPSAATFATLVGKNSGAGGWYTQVDDNGSLEYCGIGATTNCYNTGSVDLATGTWKHVVMQITFGNNSTLKFYVNGTLLGTGTWDQNDNTYPTLADTPFNVGANGDGSEAYNGLVDDVRIYNRLLTADEISDLYTWTPGPVGYWKFDENTGTTAYDSSGYGNTGTLTDGPSYSTGKFGAGILFDGTDDHVDAGSGAILDDLPQLTASAWFYPTSDPGTSQRIMGKPGTSTTQGWRVQYEGGGNMSFNVITSGTPLVNQTVNGVITQNQWNHVALTWTGSIFDYTTAKFYVNGILASTDTGNSSSAAGGSTRPSDASTNFCIGMRCTTSTGPFKGKIDDVKVYNYVRTAAEVVEDMNAGHPAPGSPIGSPIGHWKFDEGFGDTAYNSGTTGSTNNGNMAGSGTACPQSADSACPTWSNSGKINKALTFDTSATTDDYVDAGDINALDSATQLTYSTWVKFTTLTDWQMVMAKRNSGTQKISMGLSGTGDGGNNDVELMVASSSGNSYAYTDANLISTGTWYHWVMVYDGSQSTNTDRIKFYLNGKQQSLTFAGTIDTSTGSNANSLLIGYEGVAGTYVNGLIDEVKVYNFALTSDQVKTEASLGAGQTLGSLSTDSSGVASWSANDAYCPPGQGSTCTAPVAHWKMDENTGSTMADSSTNNNISSTFTGNTTWTTGKFGQALTFDGVNDAVTIADNSTLDLGGTSDSYTVGVWIKTAANFGGNVTVINKWDGTAGTFPFWVYLTSSELPCFEMWGSATVTICGSTALNDNKWHYIAGVRSVSADWVYLYVDGVLVNSTQDTTSVTMANNSLTCVGNGGTGTCTNSDYSGQIDDVRIYNYARSAAQINWDYNRGKPIAWWKMDETAANSCTGGTNDNCDSSGNGYDLAWGGNATFTSSGKYNYGTTYDSSGDYAACTDANCGGTNKLDLHPTPQVSWGAWFKSTGSGLEIIAGKRNTTDNVDAGYVMYQTSANLLSCKLGDGTTNSAATSVATINDSAWHHGMCVNTGTTLKLYLDGKLIDSIGSSGITGTVNNASDFRTGTTGSGISSFTGTIDDVRVYSYPLSEAQIQLLLNEDAAVRWGQ